MKVAASILSIQDKIVEKIQELDHTSIDYLHLDIMDGKFVPNKTWTVRNLQTMLLGIRKPKDIHFMVRDVMKYVDEYKVLQPEYMTFHYENGNIEELIQYIHSQNIKVGIALKPDTSVDYLIPYLDMVDLILVMTVEPGRGGQAFIEECASKVNELKILRDYNHYSYVIEVDGGINEQTATLVWNADCLVVGSYITNNEDYEMQVNRIKR